MAQAPSEAKQQGTVLFDTKWVGPRKLSNEETSHYLSNYTNLGLGEDLPILSKGYEIKRDLGNEFPNMSQLLPKVVAHEAMKKIVTIEFDGVTQLFVLSKIATKVPTSKFAVWIVENYGIPMNGDDKKKMNVEDVISSKKKTLPQYFCGDNDDTLEGPLSMANFVIALKKMLSQYDINDSMDMFKILGFYDQFEVELKSKLYKKIVDADWKYLLWIGYNDELYENNSSIGKEYANDVLYSQLHAFLTNKI